MMDVLYVGDPHGRPEDLDDCEALVTLVEDVVTSQKVHRITFLGDQHHTHAIMHVEVLGFWRRSLQRLLEASPGTDIYFMLGNHDQPGDASSKAHALMAYEDMPGVVVVDRPILVEGVLHVPYMHSGEAFVETCTGFAGVARPPMTLVCHQTFNGAKYENGFFAKDGVDPERVPQKYIISGHIHDPQSFGKVVYLGSPRWLTISDANKDRFLNIVTHDEDGVPVNIKPIPTESALRKIHHIVDSPESPADNVVFNPKHRYHVDVQGPSEWVDSRRSKWTGKARVRTTRLDKRIARVRESEGIDAALLRFLASYNPPRGTDRATLEKLAHARILRPQ